MVTTIRIVFGPPVKMLEDGSDPLVGRAVAVWEGDGWDGPGAAFEAGHEFFAELNVEQFVLVVVNKPV